MWYLAYTLGLMLAAPFAALWLALNPRHRALLRRFHPPVPPANERPLWVHACSVGEIKTAMPILKALQAEWPNQPIVLTTSTASGRTLADTTTLPADAVTWLPFDHPWAVRSFLHRLNPRVLIIIETELWPALLRETSSHSVPIAVVNGRLSAKHFQRNKRFAPLLRPFVAKLSAAAVQNQTYSDRFATLGLPRAAITVTGNTKIDGVPSRSELPGLEKLRDDCAFPPNTPILIFGSTRPGDEQRAADCWKRLRVEFPGLRLIIAPRHPNRIDEALAPFDEPIRIRSQHRDKHPANSERIFAVDTLGELTQFYALATVAVVGGSFSEDVQGHNPLEPAALGVATIFGPHMANFAEPAKLLLHADAALQVSSDEDLYKAIHELLANEQRRAQFAAAANQAIEQNKGAIARTIEVLRPLIER